MWNNDALLDLKKRFANRDGGTEFTSTYESEMKWVLDRMLKMTMASYEVEAEEEEKKSLAPRIPAALLKSFNRSCETLRPRLRAATEQVDEKEFRRVLREHAEEAEAAAQQMDEKIVQVLIREHAAKVEHYEALESLLRSADLMPIWLPFASVQVPVLRPHFFVWFAIMDFAQAISLAAEYGDMGLMRALLEIFGPKFSWFGHSQEIILSQFGQAEQTALHAAAQAGQAEIVKYLLTQGVNKEQENKKGLCPAEVAAKFGYIKCSDLLDL